MPKRPPKRNPQHWRSCHRQDGSPKVGHATRLEAEEEIGRANMVDCSPYECALCGKWHVGRTPTRFERFEVAPDAP